MNVDVHFGGDLCHLHHGESRCHGHDQVTRPCLFMAAVGYHKLSAGCQLPLPRQGLYSARAWMDFKSCLRPQSRPQTNFDVCGNKVAFETLYHLSWDSSKWWRLFLINAHEQNAGVASRASEPSCQTSFLAQTSQRLAKAFAKHHARGRFRGVGLGLRELGFDAKS